MDFKKEADNIIKLIFKNKRRTLICMSLIIPIPFIMIITNTIWEGYLLQYIQNIIKKKYVLPKFEKLGKLWVRGFFIQLINLLYFFPILMFILIVSFILKLKTSIFFIGIPFFLILWFFVNYVIMEYAYTERFTNAITFWKIARRIWNLTYLRAAVTMAFFWIIIICMIWGIFLGVYDLIT